LGWIQRCRGTFLSVFVRCGFNVPQLNNRENQQLEEYYSTCIRCFFSERSTTVLHAAVWHADEYGTDPNMVLKIMKLSLKLGAYPNVIDEFGKTPLHHLAAASQRLQEHLPLFQALVDAGGHLYIAKYKTKTVLSILKRWFSYVKGVYRGYSAPHTTNR
jgi:ankyrin repeat protein